MFRNPLLRTWRDLFKRPSRARFVPSDLKLDERTAEKKPHPLRRKTDRWPRE